MTQPTDPRSERVRAEAIAWLAEELEWERRLDSLRRPGHRPRKPTRRPAPAVVLARAS